MAEEELLVTLCRGDSGSGGSFGFSLLGASASAGLPAAHVIYDIVENSPAARSGKNVVHDLLEDGLEDSGRKVNVIVGPKIRIGHRPKAPCSYVHAISRISLVASCCTF
ncbi:uncharacterized protein LOC105431617 isoform X1 [Pogonomyrmex barbatus]|uniref:Uncharacterized protein LOC105431617 isoform X1 n=1 Tax=Pogonomyrmex barbatus TaxID=144034 RepID=A0A8N1SB78_9HYME|nr:uncharacterized protein LOC105431617 isoform X1 [Pogonomyrmex barbatus]